MYADFSYYQGTYHGTVLTEAQWPAAAREADAWLDRLTLDRLRQGAPVDDAVRMAACAMAEVAGRYQTAVAERTPGLASATNDGYSESYAGAAADLVEQEQAELQAAADLYLPRTHPLRYRGAADMLCCDETVTLYHRSYDPASRADVWNRTVYTTASWYGGQAASVSDNGLMTADAYTVRINTAAAIPAAPGDVLVRGEVDDTVTGSTALTGKYQGRCFVVTHVQDNRRGARRLWHWRIEGK